MLFVQIIYIEKYLFFFFFEMSTHFLEYLLDSYREKLQFSNIH